MRVTADNPRLARVAKKEEELPLRPVEDLPTPLPAWVALAAAWTGLVMLIASIVLIFLPGSTHPREELEHRIPYSVADKFIAVPIYGITLALALGLLVFKHMRKLPRPLPEALVMQRVQATVGIVLALIGAIIIYTWVGFRGPR